MLVLNVSAFNGFNYFITVLGVNTMKQHLILKKKISEHLNICLLPFRYMVDNVYTISNNVSINKLNGLNKNLNLLTHH